MHDEIKFRIAQDAERLTGTHVVLGADTRFRVPFVSREPKVSYGNLSIRLKEDILRLQVTMEDTGFMHGLDSVDDLDEAILDRLVITAELASAKGAEHVAVLAVLGHDKQDVLVRVFDLIRVDELQDALVLPGDFFVESDFGVEDTVLVLAEALARDTLDGDGLRGSAERLALVDDAPATVRDVRANADLAVADEATFHVGESVDGG